VTAGIVIVSNRGPVSFELTDDGGIVERRGGGGLVSALGGLGGTDSTWIAAAATPGDRVVAGELARQAAGFEVSLLDLDVNLLDDAYDRISNETLWFLHHGMFDAVHTPAFDEDWYSAWEQYRIYNDRFADRVAELAADNATVLVQDLHLSLMADRLRSLRPDVVPVHFHHTPFCTPEELSVLPARVRDELIGGLSAAAACGFHTATWAQHFRDCARSLNQPTHAFVSPITVDAEALMARANEADVTNELALLDESVGDRRYLVRVDRIELSKNLLRGFAAFDELLAARPDLRERVVFGAFCYPSRLGVAAYRRYHDDVRALVERINDRWSTPDWTPIDFRSEDNYARSLAALKRADVVLVNPIRDGLNLVAKETALLSRRNAAIVLSDRAGCAAEIGEWCDLVHPFDVSETARALGAAFDRDPLEAQRHADSRLEVTRSRHPSDWLAEQLAAAGRAR
jgi:trehalose 6-phosphate synthase